MTRALVVATCLLLVFSFGPASAGQGAPAVVMTADQLVTSVIGARHHAAFRFNACGTMHSSSSKGRMPAGDDHAKAPQDEPSHIAR